MLQFEITGLLIYRTVIKQLLSSLLFFLLFCNISKSQDYNLSNTLISLAVNKMPLSEVLTAIEQQTTYKFAYSSELVEKQKKVTVNVRQVPLKDLLLLVFKGTSIGYSFIDNQIVLQEITPVQITISGFIRDSTSGESLPGTVIYFPENKTGTYTNNYGFYSISQNIADSLEMMVLYVGFNKITTKVSATNNLTQNFYLTESKTQLNPVLVTRNKQDDNLKKHQLGKTNVSLDMIQTVSAFNGNGDIINTIQMLPGVLAGLDGRSGFFIRGGNTDQNLVMLDEATLYNPNHLLGLVSIFNPYAMKNATLLKGGFPASFGDHLSSVLDITMKDGNNQQPEGDLQLGAVSSSFTLSVPVLPGKSSFFIAARRSTIDLLLKPMTLTNYYQNNYFYDVNAKMNFQISSRDRIYLSFYQGRDNSSFLRDSTTNNAIGYEENYGNQAIALRWNHIYSQKIFSNTALIYNDYFQSVTATQKKYYAQLYSGIRDIDFKTDFNFYPNKNQKLSAGINFLYQTLHPASVSNRTISADSIVAINPSEIPKKHSGRLAVYFSDEIWLTPKLSAYIGARLPYIQLEDVRYIQFEPRLALLQILNPTTSIKISYTHMNQYLHLVQSCNASFPAEIWIGSSKAVKPQNSRQISAGLFKNFKEDMFQSSIEVYYKHMGNQMVFKGESKTSIYDNIESTLLFGQARSFGTEILLRKNTGKLTGWLAYTLSFSYQQFDSLNLGKEYPFANDRRHCFYVALKYAISRHWEISSNFHVTSGSAFTLNKNVTTSGYPNPLYDNYGGADFSTTQIVQNNFRLAPYNRVDLSIRYKHNWNVANRNIEGEWVLSVYNVYARSNTFFAYRSIDPVTKQPLVMQVSFVPIIPSISYHLNF